MPPIDELDQLAEMHQAGAIDAGEYARGVASVLAQDDDEAMQAALGIRPVRPWVQKLKCELRELDDAWKAHQRKFSNPVGLAWADNRPSYLKAVPPAIAAVVFGVAALSSFLATPWNAPAAAKITLQIAPWAGLFCLVGILLSVFNLFKAAGYNRALADYEDGRLRLILKRCEEHYGPARLATPPAP